MCIATAGTVAVLTDDDHKGQARVVDVFSSWCQVDHPGVRRRSEAVVVLGREVFRQVALAGEEERGRRGAVVRGHRTDEHLPVERNIRIQRDAVRDEQLFFRFDVC